MGKALNAKQLQMRERIAQAAARLIAQDGVHDYALAKRKAARQLGAPDTHSLPSNGEVEQAVRAYQALYQKDEHAEHLRRLRIEALDWLRLLERFNPYLTGSVLNGTASRHSDINVQLFTDSSKDVELFLLGRGLAYKAGEKKVRAGDGVRLVPTLTLVGPQALLELAVLEPEALRTAPRVVPEGKLPERARAAQLEALLEAEPAE
ncbi:MAG: hypothetical protein M0T84_03495 [Betaproteobacteria bacterium]|nr:hypothetical protein [Betaproteobacteria bacterium]